MDGIFNNLGFDNLEDFLDDLQTGLDVGGLTPGVGLIPDLANTAISLGRGNWGDAAFSLGAAIPVLGQGIVGIKTAVKMTGKNKIGTIFVDSKSNAIVTPRGGTITGSPDGRFIQARDANGNFTDTRIDGAHSPNTHTDPRALTPHGHVPGTTNADGTSWLPIYK